MNTSMSYRPLGNCGTKVSALGLGGWITFGGSVLEEKTIREILTTAYEAGINFFDIADVYARGEAERAMGAVLKEFPRHRLVISSKVYFPISEDVNDRGLSRKHIFESIDKSLKRIGTEYLDIYFCHRADAETPLEETVRAMDDLVHQGKILYWGTSEWSRENLGAVHQLSGEKNYYRPQVEQPQYNLLERRKFETETRDIAVKNGMGIVVWSPLASGLLTGKYDEGFPPKARLSQIEWLREEVVTEDALKKVRRFKGLAEEIGCTRAQLALAWLLRQRGISSVITGATRLEQLRENLQSLALKIPKEIEEKMVDIFPL